MCHSDSVYLCTLYTGHGKDKKKGGKGGKGKGKHRKNSNVDDLPNAPNSKGEVTLIKLKYC